MQRLDLEGHRVTVSDATDVWLVFHGRRHRIASEKVFRDLFTHDARTTLLDVDINAIDSGPDLNDGTCLIRSTKSGIIYLLTGTPVTARLIHIENYETMVAFAFDIDRVVDVPQLVIDALPRARSLWTTGVRGIVESV